MSKDKKKKGRTFPAPDALFATFSIVFKHDEVDKEGDKDLQNLFKHLYKARECAERLGAQVVENARSEVYIKEVCPKETKDADQELRIIETEKTLTFIGKRL